MLADLTRYTCKAWLGIQIYSDRDRTSIEERCHESRGFIETHEYH